MFGQHVTRIRAEVPDAVAIFLVGSHVRGEAGPHSDVDFDVVAVGGPRDEFPAWFDGTVRVSLWIRDVDRWLAAEGEPQGWAFFLPCADPMRLCWAASQEWRERLDRQQMTHPAGAPELDHFVSYLAKAANAHAAGDDLALRLAAQDLAMCCPAMLSPLNPRPPVTSRPAALRMALGFEQAPPNYAADLLTCLGFTAGEVYVAATRLGNGILDLMRANAAAYESLLPADQYRDLNLGPGFAR